MAKYITVITNAGGTRSEVYVEYDNARDALRHAARIGRKIMFEAFGPDDGRSGQEWRVVVLVAQDERGNTYKTAGTGAKAPCIYTKSILCAPTPR